MKKITLFTTVVMLSLGLIGCSGGGDSSATNSSSAITVTAVDGYIKDANITDAAGQVGVYTSNGHYTFANSIAYPLTLTGGRLEDTNASFDINITAQSGLIISPITAFLENNSTLLGYLSGMALNGNQATLSEFGVDFIDSNSSDLSKLSQLLYIVLKDENLTKEFKVSLATNPNSFSQAYTLLEEDVNASNFAGKRKMRYLLNKIKDYNGSVSGMETYIKNFKNSLVSSAVDRNRTIVKTGQTTVYATNDDGTYQSGVARSYSLDGNTNETVIDNATGLIWQKEDDNVTKYWATAGTYCGNITLDGNSSFRLPTVEELSQLADYGRSSPAIDPIFTNTDSSFYWSSTTYAPLTTYAWIVSFNSGTGVVVIKTDAYYVRCVR